MSKGTIFLRAWDRRESKKHGPGEQALLFSLTLPWCAFLQLILDQSSFDDKWLICHLSYYLLVFFKALQLRKKQPLNSISLGQKLSLAKRKDCTDQNKWKSILWRHWNSGPFATVAHTGRQPSSKEEARFAGNKLETKVCQVRSPLGSWRVPVMAVWPFLNAGHYVTCSVSPQNLGSLRCPTFSHVPAETGNEGDNPEFFHWHRQARALRTSQRETGRATQPKNK